MALGDSLTESARKDEDMHEIHSICRSVQSHTYSAKSNTPDAQTLFEKNLKALSRLNWMSAEF